MHLTGYRVGQECSGPSDAITFDRRRLRSVQTAGLIQPQRVLFDLRVGALGACARAEAGDEIVLEYSLDGRTFTTYKTYPLSAHTVVDETLPVFPPTALVYLMVRQKRHSGLDDDEWSIRNFAVVCE